MTGLLQRLATLQAERRPDAPAVTCLAERLTYGELERASNRLARLLTAHGARRGDRIGFLLPKSLDAIVAILGILKADGVYVPLDVASPAPRIARILDLCESRLVLSSGAQAARLAAALRGREGAPPVHVGWMDDAAPDAEGLPTAFTRRDLAGMPDTPPACANTPADAAYILFTSGSTGVPKGVVVTHDSVGRFVDWAVRYFAMGPSDRLSGHPPLHFDLSVFDLFGTLASGAQLHLVPGELNLLPNTLAEFIRSAELTQWFSVPSVLAYAAKLDVVRPGDFPTLRRLLWCGEVFPTPALIYFMRRLPHVTFTNLYGPTEATIASSCYTLPACPDDEQAQVPIGTPCDGEELLVLDADLRPVAPGEAGELYIGGVGLSPGYWKDPEQTRRAFLPHPRGADPAARLYRTGDLARIGEDGLVYFLGRNDEQIKSRGYRIELGEVETAVGALDCLKESAIVAVPTGGFEGTAIACAYVPSAGGPVTPAHLREALAARLPAYMLPSRWLALDALPRNANGKIDRRALREAFVARASGGR